MKKTLKQCFSRHKDRLFYKDILFYTVLTVLLVLWYAVFGCPLRWATGIPCAGCGMTRAVVSLLKGDVQSALHFHPLVFILPAVACIYLCRGHISKRVLYVLAALAALLFAAVYFYRLLSGSGTVSVHFDEGAFFRLFKYIFG